MNGTSAAYDARGNMTTDPVTGKTYSYLGSTNQLYVVSSPFASHSYDALSRLVTVSNGGIDTNYVSDGDDTIAEYDASSVLQKRYAFDSGSDGPLVQYDAAGNRTWMMADERGSIVALANDSATLTAINTYDEYGNPGASNTGTFQYTGQMWLSRAGQYWYRSRSYGATLGRFSQTDPIGYGGDGPNLYAYVLNDPVNFTDPFGLGGVWSWTCEKGSGKGPPYCHWVWLDTNDIVQAVGQRLHGFSNVSVSATGTFGPPRHEGSGPACLAPNGCFNLPPKNEPAKPNLCASQLPPASRTYSIPPGYHQGTDPQNRFIYPNGSNTLVMNPAYRAARQQAGGVNWGGVAIDLGKIAVGVGLGMLGGPIGSANYMTDVNDVARAGWLVTRSAGGAAWNVSSPGNQCRK